MDLVHEAKTEDHAFDVGVLEDGFGYDDGKRCASHSGSITHLIKSRAASQSSRRPWPVANPLLGRLTPIPTGSRSWGNEPDPRQGPDEGQEPPRSTDVVSDTFQYEDRGVAMATRLSEGRFLPAEGVFLAREAGSPLGSPAHPSVTHAEGDSSRHD